MRNGLLTAAGAVLALALGGLVAAQDAPPPGEASTTTETGTVVSSSPTELVIEAEGGARHRFEVDTRTVVSGELKPGTRVSVEYAPLSGQRRLATRVSTAGGPSSGTSALGSSDEPGGTADPELPATASPIPLVGLVGLVALAGAVTLRLWRRDG